MVELMTDTKDRSQLPAAVVNKYQDRFIREISNLTKLPMAHWLRLAFDLLILHLRKIDPITYNRVFNKLEEEDQNEIRALIESTENPQE